MLYIRFRFLTSLCLPFFSMSARYTSTMAFIDKRHFLLGSTHTLSSYFVISQPSLPSVSKPRALGHILLFLISLCLWRPGLFRFSFPMILVVFFLGYPQSISFVYVSGCMGFLGRRCFSFFLQFLSSFLALGLWSNGKTGLFYSY